MEGGGGTYPAGIFVRKHDLALPTQQSTVNKHQQRRVAAHLGPCDELSIQVQAQHSDRCARNVTQRQCQAHREVPFVAPKVQRDNGGAKTQKLFTQKLLDPKATPLATLTPRPNPSLSLTTEKLLNRKATLPTACYRPMSSPGPGGTVHVPHLGVFIAAYAPRQFHQVSSPRVGGCGVPCSRLSQCGNSEPPPPTPPLCPPTPPLLRVVGMPFPALRRL